MIGRSGIALVLVVLTTVLLGCAPRQQRISTRDADDLYRAGKLEEARTKYEEYVKQAPDQPEIHFKLSTTLFDLARKSLDEQKDEKAYAELLGKSQEEAIAGLELDPDNPSGHTLLGILAAYRSDMDAARESFEIARQLDPVNPTHYINLAEVSVYRGKLVQARRYMERARRLRGNPALIELDEVLAAWRAGDYIEAQDTFNNLMSLNPDVVKKQYGAENIETFEQFTAECCEDVSCGPFMKPACAQANQRVAERKLLQETLKQQIELEKERKERMAKVYDRLREIDIQVEESEDKVDLGDEPPAQPEPEPRRGPGGQQQRRRPGTPN
jgi:Flp pilus assembly protein TadD